MTDEPKTIGLAAGTRPPGRPPKGPPVIKSCLQCGASFEAPSAQRDIYHFCSDACRWNFHEAKSRLADARASDAPETPETLAAGPPPPATTATPSPAFLEANIDKVKGSPFTGRPLSPAATARLRGRIADHLASHIDLAAQAVEGKIAWTPTQARVFATLLGKVVPDLSASHTVHESITTPAGLSREQLERIASGVDDIIDGEPPEHIS